jgi:hypothetical protein
MELLKLQSWMQNTHRSTWDHEEFGKNGNQTIVVL